jgi:hypothetical protein
MRGCFRFTRWWRRTELATEGGAGWWERSGLAASRPVASCPRPPGRHDRRRGHDPVIGHALCGQEPSVNDPPFIPAAGREIQQRRLSVLKLNEKFQRIFSGRPARFDRLRSDPAVPFPKNLLSGYSLLHRRMFPATTKRGD